MYVFLISFLLLSACKCGQSARDGEIEKVGKDGFVVTWGPENGPNPYAFSHLPRTVNETNGTDWKPLDDGCQNKDLHYVGKRYIWKDDISAFPIYDVAGKVAGIQAVIRKDIADKNGAVDYSKHPASISETINGVEVYTFTAYFVDPSTICKSGRTDVQLKTDGTFSTLYIQKGLKPVEDSVKTPKTEGERDRQFPRWVKGKCVATMGMHYFYDQSYDQDCNTTFSYFLMYDVKGEMTGFGYYLLGEYKTIRYEYLTRDSLSLFMDPVPKCQYEFYDNGGIITSFHVFIEPEPKTITCA